MKFGTAMAVDGVTYLNDDGSVTFATETVTATSIDSDSTNLSEGWYVVDRTVTISSRIPVTGDGTTTTTFAPHYPASRGQVVTFLYRFFN